MGHHHPIPDLSLFNNVPLMGQACFLSSAVADLITITQMSLCLLATDCFTIVILICLYICVHTLA